MELDRRQFFKGAALAGGAALTVGMAGCLAPADSAAEKPAYLPDSWDYETDILVIGYGGAGAAAAITACDEELGEVLVIEKAPEEFEGGNTRVSGQYIFCPNSVKGALEYQGAANSYYKVDEAIMKAWAENLCQNADWLASLGADVRVQRDAPTPEFAELPGADTVRNYFVDGVVGNMALWWFLKDQQDRFGFTVFNETRATKLIHDPASKEVYGCTATTADGKTINIKAKKGVLLACGGFENDPQMIKDYSLIGNYEITIFGTEYNTGDGIRMAQALGADLWHMNNFSAMPRGSKFGGLDTPWGAGARMSQKDYIFVGPNSQRFMYEEVIDLARHGKLDMNGIFKDEHMPLPCWIVFGSATFEGDPIYSANTPYGWIPLYDKNLGVTNQEFVNAGVIFKGETAEELAGKIGLSAQTLTQTINTYNGFCVAGADLDYKRGTNYYDTFGGLEREIGKVDNESTSADGSLTVVIDAFELQELKPPYYAIQMWPLIINTQGGPRRGVGGEVLDVEGNPIPRLYEAGELGCVYSYMYNGGGNVSEALSSGRLAARNIAALEPWEV